MMNLSCLKCCIKAIDSGQHDFERVWNRFEGTLLRQILHPILQDYDFIILDCAPGYNLLTRSALVASDFYLLPTKSESLSIVGIQLLERRIAKLKESHEENGLIDIQMLGIVFNMSANLITTGRYYRKVMYNMMILVQPKFLRLKYQPMLMSLRAVDSFMPVVLTNPQSAGAKAFTS